MLGRVFNRQAPWEARAALVAVVFIGLLLLMQSQTRCANAQASCDVGSLESFASAITVNEDGNDADSRFEGDTEANLLYLDAGNDRVGLGTSSPGAMLDVNGDQHIRDSNGLVIGHTAQQSLGGITPEFQIVGTGLADSSGGGSAFSADGNGPLWFFAKSRNATAGSHTIIQNGDDLGSIFFSGSNGTNFNSASAQIKAEADAATGTSDLPGRLIFSTTADGANAVTERVRIDSAGLVTIASTGHLLIPVKSDATRGAAGTAGRIIFNTTDGNLNIDNGTNWILPDGTTT